MAAATKRGIVTLAGGPDYAVNAYAMVRLLRHHGCTLPVEWYYLSAAEMPRPWLEAIASLVTGVEFHDLRPGESRDYNAKEGGGFQAKTQALLASRFEEVLFLDADNMPLRDPTFLFDCPPYATHGALFWPDQIEFELDRWPVLSKEFGVPFDPAVNRQLESGQLMIDKRRCLQGLRLADQYNRRDWRKTYQWIYGDKDTFYFAWAKLGLPLCIVPYAMEVVPGAFSQKHPLDGSPLFCHLVAAKWSLGGRPLVFEKDLPTRDFCETVIRQLRERLCST